MESSTVVGGADEAQRIKFLCSFGGSILPRPVDGRLRYVGGDTRIVTVPRDITFDELLAKMQELFEGVGVIKYQQPDEDLDALVSVVNDDDVMNMMEEYDKLGTGGDGFTRLRIFLFSQYPELDASAVIGHFDIDERETERRYVDALNSVPETRSPASPDERYLGAMGVDMGMPNCTNLHHINIPHGQRVGEMDVNWSPGYFSPGQHVGHDYREFPHSPSSSRFHFGVGEFGDRILDDHVRVAAGNQMHHYSHHSPSPVDTMVWLPVGSVVQEQSGFPNNLGHSHNAVEGNSICENCRMSFQRRHGAVSDLRYVEPRWKVGQPHVEQPNMVNDYTPHFQNSCAHCYHNPYMMNQDLTFDHAMYIKEQREFHRAPYNESHIHNQGWAIPNHHVNCRIDEARIHHPGTGRVNEQYVVDGTAVNSPFKPVNSLYDGLSLPSHCMGHEEMHYLRRGNESGNAIYLSPHTVGSSLYANSSVVDEATVQYANQPLTHGDGSLYHVPQNLSPIPCLQRHAHVHTRQGALCEMSGTVTPNGPSIAGYTSYAQEGNPRPQSERVNDQISPDTPGQYSFIPQNVLEFQEPTAPLDHLPAPVTLPPSNHVPSAFIKNPAVAYDAGLTAAADNNLTEVHEHAVAEIGEDSENQNDSDLEPNITTGLHELKLNEGKGYPEKMDETDNPVAQEDANVSDKTLTFLPELIASAKEAVLKSAEEVIVKARENPEEVLQAESRKDQTNECRPEQNAVEVDADFEGDAQQENPSKIEETTAEDEALANGLQTIRNEDLEEIRALGSGTYGSVFYGKWRGSDVAIKRIKASCFAGKPSERARLIADFWKEALLMSTLHHPNIVSFYGVVRDGPDGSLATVTEFMVNGSLKQFLQKKDRTVDRRKRLIIAMDVAFGMEYLHSKNIVHFDMKCENLLVNMRDPHRPICKIGDLGLSKVKHHTLVSGGVRGTLPWMAPELLSGNNSMVSEKIDVYSFGIVMWELLTGEDPYADMRSAAVIGGIINNSLRPKIPTWCDPEWKSLMESCWSSDPTLRPSFSEISQILRKMAAAINLK